MTTAVGVRRRVYPDLDQALLRGLVVLGASTAVVAAQVAGARPAGWLTVVLLGLALVTAVRPDSAAAVLLLGGTAYVWVLVPDPRSPLVLLASAGMVLVHVCALVAAQGPARMRVDRVQLGRWLVRGVMLWLAAVGAWVVVALLEERPGGRLVYAAGLVVLTSVAVLTTWLISSRRLTG